MVNLYKIRKQLVIIDLKWIMIFFFFEGYEGL